jgi:hypothetical protein
MSRRMFMAAMLQRSNAYVNISRGFQRGFRFEARKAVVRRSKNVQVAIREIGIPKAGARP